MGGADAGTGARVAGSAGAGGGVGGDGGGSGCRLPGDEVELFGWRGVAFC